MRKCLKGEWREVNGRGGKGKNESKVKLREVTGSDI